MSTRTDRRRPRRPRQLSFKLPTWGGRRKGAGRKRRGWRPGDPATEPGSPHLARPTVDPRLPLHVTLRMAPHVFNLRSDRAMKRVGASLAVSADRFGVRIVQFSVQGNHVHLLVEAADRPSLARAMKGLGVRIARGMNRLMRRSGRVLADRYHARALRTPAEVRNAAHSIRHNRRHHLAVPLPAGFVDPCSSDAGTVVLPVPSTWLLRVGWRRARGRRRAT